MFAGIRKAMKLPLARPPGRQGLLARFAPEWGVGLLYGGILVTAGILSLKPERNAYSTMSTHMAVAITYGLVGLLLIVGPMLSGVRSWARERDRGTLDALLLTPQDHAALVRGRFWNIFRPWARFLAWLLPLYILVSTFEIFQESVKGDSRSWQTALICVFSLKPLFPVFPEVGDYWIRAGNGEWSLPASALALLRWLNEFSVPLFACAAACYLSARSRSVAHALARASFWIPLALLVVLSLHDWWLLILIWTNGPFSWISEEAALLTYGFLGLISGVARWYMAFWLLRLTARNFDYYALGERPEST